MDDLTFKNCALKEFNFLVNEYGFRCTKSDTYYLRFESKIVFVELYYDDQRSFEMDFSIGLLDDLYEGKERPFYLVELVKYSAPNDDEDYRLIQASTPEKIAQLLPKLANLVKTYAKEFLSGNKTRFKDLSYFRENRSNQYAMGKTLKDVRAAARKAWENEDYARVIELYEPVKKYITPSERKKLEYCHNRQI